MVGEWSETQHRESDGFQRKALLPILHGLLARPTGLPGFPLQTGWSPYMRGLSITVTICYPPRCAWVITNEEIRATFCRET